MPNTRQLITAKEVRQAQGTLTVAPNAIITPSARDLAESLGVRIVTQAVEETHAPEEEPIPDQAGPENLARRIDHTNLAPDASADDILRLCDEAIRYGFASVCVHPIRVALAAKRLDGRPTAVCGVVGFPSGGHDSAVKALEATLCVRNGAREIDMVAHAGLLRDDNINAYHADISAVRSAIGADTILKVIIEAPLLDSSGIVRAAAIAANAGANFVKTSTGVYTKAREEDVILLRRALPAEVGIKAAGGIRTAEQARKFFSLGADRIGTSTSVQIVQESAQ